MNIDSEIARIVLLNLAKKGEACLCIHDSFIVEEKNQEILRQMMTETYTQVISKRFSTERLFTCPIK